MAAKARVSDFRSGNSMASIAFKAPGMGKTQGLQLLLQDENPRLVHGIQHINISPEQLVTVRHIVLPPTTPTIPTIPTIHVTCLFRAALFRGRYLIGLTLHRVQYLIRLALHRGRDLIALAFHRVRCFVTSDLGERLLGDLISVLVWVVIFRIVFGYFKDDLSAFIQKKLYDSFDTDKLVDEIVSSPEIQELLDEAKALLQPKEVQGSPSTWNGFNLFEV